METATHYKHDGSKPVRTSSYAQGVAQLREAGQERPFTFRENILARVKAYERGDKTLFNTWLDSCTSVVNEQGTTRFKINPKSANLIDIPKNEGRPFLPVMYDGVPARDLDSRNGKYNQLLEWNEVESHEGWREALENDVSLLRAYRDIIFKGFKKEKAMAFCVRQNTKQDELRALFVHDLNYNSIAYGNDNLIVSGSFLRGSPVVGAPRGALREKTGSAYRNPAMKEEERLEEQVREILSPYEQLKSPATAKLYHDITEKMVREVKELLKRQ